MAPGAPGKEALVATVSLRALIGRVAPQWSLDHSGKQPPSSRLRRSGHGSWRRPSNRLTRPHHRSSGRNGRPGQPAGCAQQRGSLSNSVQHA